MRFGIANLFILTLAVSLFCGMARLLMGRVEVLLPLCLSASYAFAPLLLTFCSQFFQKYSVRSRRRTAYAVLLLMGMLPAVALLALHALAALAFAVVVLGFWAPQIDILNELHATDEVGSGQE